MTLLLVWQFAQFSTVSDGKTGKPVVWFGYLQDVMFLIVVQCTVARVVNGHFDLAKTELIDSITVKSEKDPSRNTYEQG